jgi:hypothetical protein
MIYLLKIIDMKTFTILSLFILTNLYGFSQNEPVNSIDTLVEEEFDEISVFYIVPTAKRKLNTKLILETDRLRNVVFKEKHRYNAGNMDYTGDKNWDSYTLKSFDSTLYSYYILASEYEYSYSILVNKKNNKKTNLIGDYVISPKRDFFVSHQGTGMEEGGIEIFSISQNGYEMIYEETLDLLGETNINWLNETSFEIVVTPYSSSEVISKIVFTLKDGKWIKS